MEARKLKIHSALESERFANALQKIPSDANWRGQVIRYFQNGSINLSVLESLIWQELCFREYRRKPYYQLFKSFFDRITALGLLILAAPVLLLAALAIKLDSKGPVFFQQVRLGHLGRSFLILKFRTMYVGAEAHIADIETDSKAGFFKGKDDPRLTRVGKFLRRWSLDELPQLFNVLWGDMSLVGPRPLPYYDIAALPDEALIMLAVPQGITGLWQVTARGSPDMDLNCNINKDYVARRGFALDVKIIIKTIPAMISGRGAK